MINDKDVNVNVNVTVKMYINVINRYCILMCVLVYNNA